MRPSLNLSIIWMNTLSGVTLLLHKNSYEDWKKVKPPIDHMRATALMLSEMRKDNAAS